MCILCSLKLITFIHLCLQCPSPGNFASGVPSVKNCVYSLVYPRQALCLYPGMYRQIPGLKSQTVQYCVGECKTNKQQQNHYLVALEVRSLKPRNDKSPSERTRKFACPSLSVLLGTLRCDHSLNCHHFFWVSLPRVCPYLFSVLSPSTE